MTDTFQAIVGEIRDDDWIRQAMFAPQPYLAAGRKQIREFSGAGSKYSDTSPGGNAAVNPHPQWNPVTDPVMPSLASGSTGMGEAYSMMYDDNQIRATFQFGVPEFNSIASYLGKFYNPALGRLVNRGENPGLAYNAGYGLGFLFSLPLQAYYGLSATITRVIATITGEPYSKFYYMRPTMGLYWNAAQNIFNLFATTMGITSQATMSNGTVAGLTDNEIAIITNLLPDVLVSSEDGRTLNGIDLFAVATRYQRLADGYYRKMDGIAKTSGTPEEYARRVREALRAGQLTPNDAQRSYPSYGKYMTAFMDTVAVEPNSGASSDGKPSDKQPYNGRQAVFKDAFTAEMRDGSSFISFAVGVPEPSESFSNSVKEAPISAMFNGASKASRDIRFSMADGNIVGDWQKSLTDSVGSFMSGGSDAFGLSGIFQTLAGSAFADIPKMWDDSSAELTTNSYRIPLRSVYGNRLSVLLDIYLPLSLLLAGALPRSTGKHSYTSPFLCRLFSQGVTDVKLGMITKLNIKRAANNIKWTDGNLVTAIDVDIEVTSMDNLVHIPVMDSLADGLFRFFDEDTALGDYIGAMSGISLYDTFYTTPRVKLAWAKTKQNFTSMLTPYAMANWAAGTVPGRLISLISRTGEIK